MISVSVVDCVMPPPVPVMVILWVPAGAFPGTATVTVEVPEPGAGMGLGLKVAYLKVDDKVMAASKPPETVVVTVDVPEAPGATVIEEGDTLIVKFGVDVGARALSRPESLGLPQPVTRS